MRPIDSAYDRATAETRDGDPGCVTYALVSDANGPCSIVAEFDSLDDAIEAARTMDTDAAPTELEDRLGYDGSDDRDDVGLLRAAAIHGWQVVASAPAGEYWTVLSRREPRGCECGEATLLHVVRPQGRARCRTPERRARTVPPACADDVGVPSGVREGLVRRSQARRVEGVMLVV